MKILYNGSFPNGAIAHFNFIYNGELRKVKFIARLEADKTITESEFIISQGKYSLDVYISFGDAIGIVLFLL